METVLAILGTVIALFIAIHIMVLLFHGGWFLLSVLAEVIWIAALVHIAFNRFPNLGLKILWFLVVFFTNILGAVAYFLFGRPSGVVRTYTTT